ncbi:hypothetical protein I3760_01G216600 [Carya illinoinensis]|nr:hypothetical protein I3760_01G216600 [Carya illinoinensis]
METVVGVEWNDEGNGFEKSSSALSSPKQIADPVIYKLVRVEGDGRLVPATDDEIMEVGDFLEDDKSEMHDVADTVQILGCMCDEGLSSEKTLIESSEGLLKSKNSEADACKLNARLEECFPSSTFSLKDDHINQFGDTGGCPKPPDKMMESGSSAAAVCAGLNPDFSKLKGEICLDKLSIRELHEVFKATFGRETTVKDKLWLKRRISMGLTNSCDISTTMFTTKDNKLVKKGDAEGSKDVDGSFTHDPSVGTIDVNCKGSPSSHGSQSEDHQIGSGKKLRNHNVELDSGSEQLHTEQRTAKRIRKPTKRYIELSEVDSRDNSQRLMSSPKNAGLGQIAPRSFATPVRNVLSDGRTVVTRLDSLGGSGVHVPYVSRVRRSRPRKNVMALVYFAKLEKDMHHSVMSRSELGENLRTTQADSSGDNSDDNVVTVPTAKGGMRRKHHRAWTLVEVMKLVEGVSKCGAGRWSDIKRLAFASYSYRTSVDLKDKWRNLLKASFAQAPPDDVMNSRKPTSMLIPEPILERVRELAETNARVPPNLSTSKSTVGSRNSQDTTSGYL